MAWKARPQEEQRTCGARHIEGDRMTCTGKNAKAFDKKDHTQQEGHSCRGSPAESRPHGRAPSRREKSAGTKDMYEATTPHRARGVRLRGPHSEERRP